ncbi:hypothetical protein KC356_g7819 [Hortaea werneckii]|nr:hypothetical protein KC356_g7819 [Hortaea werneckii]
MPTKIPIANPLREAIFVCFAATTCLVRPDLRRQLVLVGGAATPPDAIHDIGSAVWAGALNFSQHPDGKIAFSAPQGFIIYLDLIEMGGAGCIERIHATEALAEGSLASVSDLLLLRAVTVVDRGSDGDILDFEWMLSRVIETDKLPVINAEELDWLLSVKLGRSSLHCLPITAKMKLAVFSAKAYDRHYLSATLNAKHTASDIQLNFHPVPLSSETVDIAKGADAVCCFVNDTVDAPVIQHLREHGVKAILMRCAGYNNVDLKKAEELGFFAANVPAYSPEAVAEFAVALIQTLNRNTHRAYNRVREGNFNIEGLLGQTLHGKTVGVAGTGRIGLAVARIMKGFGCRVLGHDVFRNDEFRFVGEYVELDVLLAESDIVSLHCPLLESTQYMINEASLERMKRGAMLVNTSRGGLIDTKAVIRALKSKQLGGLALDVYEGEKALFYDDHSGEIVHDDDYMRLTTFHNVLLTGHQAFFTQQALEEIAEVTLQNLEDFRAGRQCRNSLIKAEASVSRPPRH